MDVHQNAHPVTVTSKRIHPVTIAPAPSAAGLRQCFAGEARVSLRFLFDLPAVAHR